MDIKYQSFKKVQYVIIDHMSNLYSEQWGQHIIRSTANC